MRIVPALGYRWLTPAYDFVVRATIRERAFKKALIRQAGVLPGQRVLDLACGTGTLAVWMKQSHPQADVTGIDADPQVLAMARRKARKARVGVQLVQAFSTRLPFEDAAFDRVVSSLFFHHLSWDDKLATAREILRVVRPSGELHVADWGRATGLVMRSTFLGIQLLDGFRNTRDNVEGRLVELYVEAGFSEVREVRAFTTMFGTLSMYRATRAPGGGAPAAVKTPSACG